MLAVLRAGTVTPAEIEPNKMFLNGMEASAPSDSGHGRRIGYVWCYAGMPTSERSNVS